MWYLHKDNGNVGSDVETRAGDINEAIEIMQDEYNSLHPTDQKDLWELGVFHADNGEDYENADGEAWLVVNGKLYLDYAVQVDYFKDGIGRDRTVQFDNGKCDKFFAVCDYWMEIPIPTGEYAEVTIDFFAENTDRAYVRPLKEIRDAV